MSFTTNIAIHVKRELDSARTKQLQGDVVAAFAHLENAHVLGQSSTKWHTITHFRMLLWALSQRNTREILGQVVRLVGAVIITPLGLIPLGNTGGSDISPFKPMPLSEAHQKAIDAASSK